MKININCDKNKCFIDLSGELTIVYAKDLHSKLFEVFEQTDTIEIYSNSDDLDLTYIQIIISFSNYCKEHGKTFIYKFETNDVIYKLLNISGIFEHSLFKNI